MRYLIVKWKPENPDFPDTIYSEIDDDRWEYRKIEIFRDGRIGYADENTEEGETMLATEPWDDFENMPEDPNFEFSYISKDDFESFWEKRKELR